MKATMSPFRTAVRLSLHADGHAEVRASAVDIAQVDGSPGRPGSESTGCRSAAVTGKIRREKRPVDLGENAHVGCVLAARGEHLAAARELCMKDLERQVFSDMHRQRITLDLDEIDLGGCVRGCKKDTN